MFVHRSLTMVINAQTQHWVFCPLSPDMRERRAALVLASNTRGRDGNIGQSSMEWARRAKLAS